MSGICHGMAERLPALCRQATALDRIALVLADKYRHLAGTESIRLIPLAGNGWMPISVRG
jgi:hypothetical protein